MEISKLLAALCLLGAACRPPAPEPRVTGPNDFLVLGDTGAAWWGFAPGDTLLEREPAQVPEQVARAARRAVDAELGWSVPCYRYFGGEAGYVVVVDIGCPDPGEDGRALLGFTAGGKPVGPPWSLDSRRVVRAICPAGRDLAGRAALGPDGGRCAVKPESS